MPEKFWVVGKTLTSATYEEMVYCTDLNLLINVKE